MSYEVEVINQDALWKKVISELFEDFMLFFIPTLAEEIDFSMEPDFLQQELFREIVDEKKGTNYADQIIKVQLKNGEEQWILLHVEIEGSPDAHFSERMFRYFYRIYERYEKRIVALAVITSAEKTTPRMFKYSYFGTTLDYAYNIRNVSDYCQIELEESDQLFSKIILAAKYMLQTKEEAVARYQFKKRLMREVFALQEYPRKSVRAVFYFVDYLLRLPADFSKKLGTEIRPLIKKEGENMVQSEDWEVSPTLIEMFKIEREEGLKQGIEEGVNKEKEETARLLLLEGFDLATVARLSRLDEELVKNIQQKNK